MSTMTTSVESIYQELDAQGVVRLDGLIPPRQLAEMQRAFEARLGQLRWSNVDGFEKTEPYRHMVSDVLTLEQGFVDIALHPLVKEALHLYLGDAYILAEAKGWRSLPTKKDFHGWHGDAWYCQKSLDYIPREVKLAYYLTDVRSGAFQYIRGTHRQQPPREFESTEISQDMLSRVAEFKGPAGTAFLFDTSGIHRQAAPILEPRNAVFLNYHDPSVPIQDESVRSYRYHPLLLNAAFLGGLSTEDERILGFGEKARLQTCHCRKSRYDRSRRFYERLHDLNLWADHYGSRAVGKIKRIFNR
ncbi:MAG: phytanoyl-CoA dioxygenase family protein [Pirellulales bacterium]|nr:phytanoyl-CoA dioxygenase family protein [Pirellulales bacterium]